MGAERNKHSVTHFTNVDTSIAISRLKWCVAPGQVLGLWISLSPPLFSVECKHLSCGRCNVRWLTDRSRQTGSGRSDATQEGREVEGKREEEGEEDFSTKVSIMTAAPSVMAKPQRYLSSHMRVEGGYAPPRAQPLQMCASRSSTDWAF